MLFGRLIKVAAIACLILPPISASAMAAGSPTPKAVDGEQRLRNLFIEFLDQEVIKHGRDHVLDQQKEDLFQRFLVWQARRLVN
ncbi:MAG: hypothetical protein AAGB04_24220 [Pseudomonadota bacterium]